MLYGELPEVPEMSGVRGFRFTVPNPPKTAFLRLPTASEMLARLDQQKSIRRSLGRRKSQTEVVPNTKADLALFDLLRVDPDGATWDEFEAAGAIRKLTTAEVTECTRTGDQYRITVKTPVGDTVHVLNIPTAQAINTYRRNILVSTELPHNQEEIRYRTSAAVALYDAVSAEFEGYAAATKLAEIPPHHKFAATVELVQAIDDLDADFDPNS